MLDWPEGVDWIVLPAIDSTNAEARRRAEAGARGPLWITARRQTAGRGRAGRRWADAGGALFATLLFRPEGPAGAAALHSFAACLAVAELFEMAGGRVALKWPNDALLGGRKAAGVLLEGAGAGAALDWLAVGIGVNLSAHPPPEAGAAHPPTDLKAECGAAVTPDAALAAIAPAFARWSARLSAEGFAPLREAWLARAAHLGERIFVRPPGGEIEGVFEDVDADGALVLRTATGVRRIAAADVHFP